MTPPFDGNSSAPGTSWDIGLVLVAAAFGFVLLGLVGLAIFTGIALVLTEIVPLGGG